MPTTTTEVKGRLIFNSTLTRDYLCAQCFRPLVERRVNGSYQVVCAHEPDHREYIHQAEAYRLQAENRAVLGWWAAMRANRIPALQPLGLDDCDGFD